jgi:DNA-binding transcriptional MerR regulator
MSDAERAAAADRLLSIGTFGRRARLSAKALRLYDRTGLLVPAAVDPRTGYRRYRESQLLRARLIVMMRRAGVPLAQVAEIVAAPGPGGADLLTAYWAEAERRFGVQRELVSRLRTSLLSGTSPVPAGAFGIRERDIPAQLVLTEQRSLRITGLKGWLPEALHRLAATAANHGGLAGDVFVVYHGEVNEDSDGPVEVCAPVTRETVLPARLSPGAAVRLEAAHREAYVRISRAQLEFPQILSAFDAVGQWIAGSGRCQAGPPREVYLTGADVAAAAPDDPVCDVAFPVAAPS